MTRMIYLDAAASTPIAPEVVECMLPVLRDVVGNPSSGHWAGARARALVETARQQVAELAGSATPAVVFTSGATESNNLAVRGVLAASDGTRNEIVSCTSEHPAILEPLRALEREGARVRLVAVDQFGRIDLDELREVVSLKTCLVSVMAANNETGVVADLHELSQIAHDCGAMFHTDASQLLAWGTPSPDAEPDLVTVSGHKMHGPQGIGALAMTRSAARVLRPVQLGGGQERGLRSGTVNVAGAVGLGEAARLARVDGPIAAPRVRGLRDQLFEGLAASLSVVLLNGHPDQRLPGTLNIAFGDGDDDVDADAVLAQMPTVAASSGSACASGALGPSPVLRAMGITDARAAASVRFGLSRLTEDVDIHEALPIIVNAVKTVRASVHGGLKDSREGQVQLI